MSDAKQLTFAIDIDGTISADPSAFCDLMCALKAGGNIVCILTGTGKGGPSGATMQSKLDYLQSVGVTKCWDNIALVTGDIPMQKALWCQQHNVDVVIDNDKDNAKALIAAGIPLVLVPWATRTPQKGKK